MEGGLTDELEQRQATLLLTNKRLMHYSSGGHSVNVVSVGLGDVDSIEVKRTEKNYQWVWVGLVFIAGGILLGLLSLLLIPAPLSPVLMAISLTLIGIVFVLTYIGGMMGEVIVGAGLKHSGAPRNNSQTADSGASGLITPTGAKDSSPSSD